ncbi:hypothetical protein COLO4_02230 [Corchorus olitorius]|uniref:Uncharacterized protein n=1 Tax=Corchorus olitorius TaxID=93759 RepID=A0A1R3KZ83_9ROSI|nr:hypothetical protein COLO4_03242 [Corchorus olitorius]OMP13129.1 hypothetical protein COLO4_02230 [Corchorus olitorius]
MELKRSETADAEVKDLIVLLLLQSQLTVLLLQPQLKGLNGAYT